MSAAHPRSHSRLSSDALFPKPINIPLNSKRVPRAERPGAEVFYMEEARTLSLLHEISGELTSILDWDRLLELMATRVKSLIDHQHFSLMLWDEGRQTLVSRFSLKFGKLDLKYKEMPLGRGVCGMVAKLKSSLRVPDVKRDPRFVTCDPSAQVASELAVPLLIKDRLIGVLNLDNTRQNAFTERHEMILRTLASSIAIALENARLYEELREKDASLEKDLDMARVVQKGLLPEKGFRTEGLDVGYAYRPARHLGGDFYDILPYAPGHTLFAVGDVSGKGTAAALYGSMATGALRGHMMQHPGPPQELLSHMNSYLLNPMLPSRFLAMIAADYDAVEHTLTLANSGLPYPLLIRNGKASEIPVVGVPLGVFPHSRYQQQKLRLEIGDAVVLYSDGITEAVNCQDQEFGDTDAMHYLLSSMDHGADLTASNFLNASVRHGCSASHEDDRTVMIIRRTE